MSKVNQDFLKALQIAGWIIKTVDEERAVVSCPRAGCGLDLAYRPGAKIHQACEDSRIGAQRVDSFSHLAKVLRERREDLCLSIKDVEEICGMAEDYLAKFEKDNPARVPPFNTIRDWAEGLGFSIWIMPENMPALALRLISSNRDKVAMRKRHFKVYRQRRKAAKE